MSTVSVRYVVPDISAAADFYVRRLGFEVRMRPNDSFALLIRGDLRLVHSARRRDRRVDLAAQVAPRRARHAPPRRRVEARSAYSAPAPARPNPIGLHRVRVLEVDGSRLRVGPLEAVDGTPVVDVKPVLAPDER